MTPTLMVSATATPGTAEVIAATRATEKICFMLSSQITHTPSQECGVDLSTDWILRSRVDLSTHEEKEIRHSLTRHTKADLDS